MAIRCPHCKTEYQLTSFDKQTSITCSCGARLSLYQDEVLGQLSGIVNTYQAYIEEDEKVVEIRHLADKISHLILNTDLPAVDIHIEKEKLRKMVATHFPDKAYLYELLYESRFKRLWEQFRSGGE